jgi:hypothetical protein
MAAPGEFGEPMPVSRSGTRLRRRWKVLLAHDARSATCDRLIEALPSALGDVELIDASSVEDARVSLHACAVDLCLVCLDLPPAPVGGVKLAADIHAYGPPLVLVTRSQRWLPADASSLRRVPWITPEAPLTALSKALIAALDPSGRRASLSEIEQAPDLASDWAESVVGRR